MNFLEYCKRNAYDALDFTKIDMEPIKNFVKENEKQIKLIFVHAVDFAQNATNNKSFLDFFSIKATYKSFELSLTRKIPQKEIDNLSKIEREEFLDILETIQVYSINSVQAYQNQVEKLYEEFNEEKLMLLFNNIIILGYTLASFFIRYQLEKKM